MSNPLYEKPTDELRQVRHTRTPADIMSAFMGKVDEWYTIQRRWVESYGESYLLCTGLKPHRDTDIALSWNMDSTEWVQTREVWRDLSTVTEAEARETPATT